MFSIFSSNPHNFGQCSTTAVSAHHGHETGADGDGGLRRVRVQSENAQKTPLTLERSFKKETIKIYIGERTPESTPYVVPKAILCKHKYFEKALSPQFAEGQTGVLHFPEDEQRAWPVVIYYLFFNDVEWSHDGSEDYERSDRDLISLAHAFLLADKYGIPALQNKIADAVIEGFKECAIVDKSTLVEIIGLIPVDCPLRWIIFERLIELVVSGSWQWKDLKDFLVFEEAFTDLMKCNDMERTTEYFPPYEYPQHNREWTKRYFVDVPKED